MVFYNQPACCGILQPVSEPCSLPQARNKPAEFETALYELLHLLHGIEKNSGMALEVLSMLNAMEAIMPMVERMNDDLMMRWRRAKDALCVVCE